jgi:hypothetical protein
MSDSIKKLLDKLLSEGKLGFDDAQIKQKILNANKAALSDVITPNFAKKVMEESGAIVLASINLFQAYSNHHSEEIKSLLLFGASDEKLEDQQVRLSLSNSMLASLKCLEQLAKNEVYYYDDNEKLQKYNGDLELYNKSPKKLIFGENELYLNTHSFTKHSIKDSLFQSHIKFPESNELLYSLQKALDIKLSLGHEHDEFSDLEDMKGFSKDKLYSISETKKITKDKNFNHIFQRIKERYEHFDQKDHDLEEFIENFNSHNDAKYNKYFQIANSYMRIEKFLKYTELCSKDQLFVFSYDDPKNTIPYSKANFFREAGYIYCNEDGYKDGIVASAFKKESLFEDIDNIMRLTPKSSVDQQIMRDLNHLFARTPNKGKGA